MDMSTDRPQFALSINLDVYYCHPGTGRAAGAKPGGTLRELNHHSKNETPPALLTRLSINPAAWLRIMTTQGFSTGATFGTEKSMNEAALRQGKRWLKGKRAAQALFNNPHLPLKSNHNINDRPQLQS